MVSEIAIGRPGWAELLGLSTIGLVQIWDRSIVMPSDTRTHRGRARVREEGLLGNRRLLHLLGGRLSRGWSCSLRWRLRSHTTDDLGVSHVAGGRNAVNRPKNNRWWAQNPRKQGRSHERRLNHEQTLWMSVSARSLALQRHGRFAAS